MESGKEVLRQMIDLTNVITDLEILHQYRFISYEGFCFTTLGNIGSQANIFDAIVIRNPSDADCFSPKFKGFSIHSLSEHIDFINANQIEKAIVIACDISFLEKCPTLKYLHIIPADCAYHFDFSPLYCLKGLKGINCATEYGTHFTKKCSLDYRYMPDIEDADIAGAGHRFFNELPILKRLNVSRVKATDASNLFSSIHLERLDITQCSIKSLSGIEETCGLKELGLFYNRSLNDVGAIVACGKTLTTLAIESCGMISDFSFLYELPNIEYLQLNGCNKLESLAFLKNMKKLKVLNFNLDVLDGDLTPCLSIPYVYLGRNRKNFNLKNSDLPKGKTKT